MSEASKFEHKGRMVRVEFTTSAPAEKVWAAWTDPTKIAQWFTDGASGEPIPGTMFTWTFDRFNYVIPYEVVDAVPNERFVLKGEIPGRPPGFLEITIRKEAGQTRVQLVNSGFLEGGEWDEEFAGIDSGWKMAMAILKLYVENYFGLAKAMALAMRPAQFTMEQLRPCFREPVKLARWLTSSGGVGRVGEAYEFALRDGTKATGRVLADTGREATLSWDEIRGTFELKSFSMGPAMRMICVRALSWEGDPARTKKIEEEMAAALDRLAEALAQDRGA